MCWTFQICVVLVYTRLKKKKVFKMFNIVSRATAKEGARDTLARVKRLWLALGSLFGISIVLQAQH